MIECVHVKLETTHDSDNAALYPLNIDNKLVNGLAARLRRPLKSEAEEECEIERQCQL